MTRIDPNSATFQRFVERISATQRTQLGVRPRPDYAADVTLVRDALVDATPEARAAFERLVRRLADLAVGGP